MLRSVGLRATPQRRAVLRQLQAADTHLSADELFQLLDTGEVALDRSTVYRCLVQLRDAGLVDVVHTGDATARYEAARAAHLHVGCQICGAARHATSPSFLERTRELFAEAGLPMADASVTVLGTCADCSPGPSSGRR